VRSVYREHRGAAGHAGARSMASARHRLHIAPGLRLPPLMFSIEETEGRYRGACALIERTGDKELTQPRRKLAQKIASPCPSLAPARLRHARSWLGADRARPANVDFSLIRRAIRMKESSTSPIATSKCQVTQRIIRPWR
jgi:predicted DNA-binding transcriptional regulator YafY